MIESSGTDKTRLHASQDELIQYTCMRTLYILHKTLVTLHYTPPH